MDASALAREYYRAVDAGDYAALADLLADDFRHDRPDRTLAGGERFVRFMREERPDPDTTHRIDGVYTAVSATGPDTGAEPAPDPHPDPDPDDDGGGAGTRVAVQGRLLRADGTPWFSFVDVFTVADDHLQSLVTYAREEPESPTG